MAVSQMPLPRLSGPEPEVVGIDDLPVLYSYPAVRGWILHSLMFPTAIRCATCERRYDCVLVATDTTNGGILCAACYGVSTAAEAMPAEAAVLGG